MENNEVATPTRSAELNKLFEALSKAQGEIRNAELNAKNPFFKSSYADLGEIVKVSRPALTKHALSVVQLVLPAADGYSYLHSVLGHASGQWIESRMKINPAKGDVQSLGSYLTYLKRYSYAALVGVVSGDEDDDGNRAVEAHKKSPEPSAPAPQPSAKITPEQLEMIERELATHTDPAGLTERFKSAWKIENLKDLPRHKFTEALDKIRQVKSRESK